MTDTKPGKLLKQGPIATLEGGLSFSDNDKFMFNGDQFVHYVAKPPKVVEASANSLIQFSAGEVYTKSTYSLFLNPSGEYRLTDGAPTYTSGTYTGQPTDTYDHVIIGYQIPVSTSQIKFWSEDYIPVEFIRVDYSYDGESYINIPTHAGNITYVFNDALKIHESETTPQGQYTYTVDLGAEFTAKYWRIRSFIYSEVVEQVAAPVAGEDAIVTTTSGLPSVVSSSGNFYYHNNKATTELVQEDVSYGAVEAYGDAYIVRDVVISDGEVGTIKAGSGIIEKQIYTVSVPGSGGIIIVNYEVTIASAATTVDVVKSTGVETLDLPINRPLRAYNPSTTPWSYQSFKSHFIYDDAPISPATYASLSGNTIETIGLSYFGAGDILYPGNYFVYSYPMLLTQVQIQERLGPQLRYWESDGSRSVTNLVSIGDIYDVIYDNSDDVYYAIRFDKGAGFGNSVISDNFYSGVGQYFDTNRWSLYGNSFTRDPSTNCLSFLTQSGTDYSGSLISSSYFVGSFTADLNSVFTVFSGTGQFGFSLLDKDNSNEVAGVYGVGDWETVDDRSISAISTSSYVNSTDTVVTLADTVFNPNIISGGLNRHTFTYVTSSGWYYSRENLTTPGWDEVDSVFNSSSSNLNVGWFSCSLNDNSVTVPNGSYVSFTTEKATATGIDSHEVILRADYDYSTATLDLLYNDGVESSILQSSFESSVVSNNFRVGIVGTNDNFTTISATSLDTTGDTEWALSCFEVVSMDVEGNRVFVDGVSDANGSVIKTFDVIEDPSKVYSDYYNTVSIATTNEGEGAGGSLFVRVGSDIYKYNKTTLPVLTPEKGVNAAILSSGISMKSEVKHFQYDGYSIGGLSYLYDDSDRGGVFMSVIDAGTLAVPSSEAELDVTAATVPLARDVSDTTVLYTVIDDDVYVFNASEDDVSFCNVVSEATLLPASSEFTTTVTALVTNMFGQPLSNKTVSFALTAGGGSISSASDCTTSSGTAVTTFTASSIEGTSLVTATASNDVC